LPSFGAEYFVFQFAIQNYKDQALQNYNFLVVLYGCETWSPTLRGNVGGGCLRIGCSREYLGLRGTR